MSKHKAEPTAKPHAVAIKLTDEEYFLLLKHAAMARRQPGPHAAWIVGQYLLMQEAKS